MKAALSNQSGLFILYRAEFSRLVIDLSNKTGNTEPDGKAQSFATWPVVELNYRGCELEPLSSASRVGFEICCFSSTAKSM